MKIIRIDADILPRMFSDGAEVVRDDGGVVRVARGLPPGMRLTGASIDRNHLVLEFDADPTEELDVEFSLAYPPADAEASS